MTGFDPQPGDWVSIRTKVIDRPIPEDVTVELFSKTGQQAVRVRVDLCEPAEKPIQDEPGDRSVALLNGTAYQRLAGGQWFAAGSTVVEGYTWAELNRRGDVEVIHHA